MVRAFIAMEVNNSKTIDRIVKLQQELMASTDADIKPVEKQNLHFTIKFLGEISESEISQQIESLRKIESECLDVVYAANLCGLDWGRWSGERDVHATRRKDFSYYGDSRTKW